MKKKKIFITIFILILILAVLAFLTFSFLNVRQILVFGNEKYTSEYIAELSGIQMNESILKADSESVKANIESIADLVFISLDIRLPDTVKLNIFERKRAFIAMDGGTNIAIDKEGYILDILSVFPEPAYTVVSGLSVLSASIGNYISDKGEFKLTTLTGIYDVLAAFNYMHNISEIDILNVNSIKIITKSGMVIRLGQADNIPDKIRFAISAINSLNDSGISEGTVDVSSGEFAVFKPNIPRN